MISLLSQSQTDRRNYNINAVFFKLPGCHYERISSGCRAKRGSCELFTNKPKLLGSLIFLIFLRGHFETASLWKSLNHDLKIKLWNVVGINLSIVKS